MISRFDFDKTLITSCEVTSIEIDSRRYINVVLTGLNSPYVDVICSDFRRNPSRKETRQTIQAIRTDIRIPIDYFSKVRIVNANGKDVLKGFFSPHEQNKIYYCLENNRVILRTNSQMQFNRLIGIYDLKANAFYYNYKDMKLSLSVLPFQESNQSEYIITNGDALKQFKLKIDEPYHFLFNITLEKERT